MSSKKLFSDKKLIKILHKKGDKAWNEIRKMVKGKKIGLHYEATVIKFLIPAQANDVGVDCVEVSFSPREADVLNCRILLCRGDKFYYLAVALSGEFFRANNPMYPCKKALEKSVDKLTMCRIRLVILDAIKTAVLEVSPFMMADWKRV